MCVAVYKPIGAEIPNREELYNCYLRNQDGAGFAFFRDGKIHIKKGYMNFDSFYGDFCKENFSKNENVFIHFRIATHGLVDGGNTHPFPITDDFTKMRDTDFTYTGKCLIHNGIFHYSDSVIKSYSKIISDTMLFSKLLFDELKNVNNNLFEKQIDKLGLEESVSRGILENDRNNLELIKKINSQLGYSKIAIMNEDGSVNHFGNWINHNGVYYSNSSYEGYKKINSIGFGGYYNTTTYNNPNYSYRTKEYWNDLWGDNKSEKYNKKRYEYCDYCASYQKGCIYIDGSYVCRSCIKDYNYKYCTVCKEWYDKSQMYDEYTCSYCEKYENNNKVENDNETDICLCCGQNYTKKEQSQEDNICLKCYHEYCC